VTLLDGPWLCGFVFEAGMEMRSKSNFRRHQRSSKMSPWERSKEFEEYLGWLARSVRPSEWAVGDRTVELAGRPVVVAAIAARSRVDVANFSKSVLDACEGVLYVTDASVLGVASVGERGDGARTFLGFAQLAPGASPGEIADALAALTAAVTARFAPGS
jgi:Holliday junction resolvase RusA-like endonuclease